MSDRPVVVLGAGPAGASAALWCASLGLPVVLLEGAAAPGGQLHAIAHPLDNLPGLPGVTGADVARTLARQLAAAGVDARFDHRAALDPAALRVRCDARRLALDAGAVVLATGARRATLGVPGERELRGQGVAYNIGHDPAGLAGKRVVIVGGGDDAFEHAALAAPHAREVTLVHRSDRYTARPALAAPVLAGRAAALRPFTRVEAIEGDGRVERVRLRGPAGVEALAADVVFVCVGPRPDSEGLGVALDPRGYVLVDRLQRTSRAGVWAAGDVCCPEAPTVATAFGQGAVAAKAVCAALAGAALPPRDPPRPAAPDRLRLDGLTLPARIGVYPRERRRTQTLTFAVEFEVDAASAAPGDALARTIDYAAVAETIEAVLSEKHYNLIETVADVVATTLLARYPTRRVRVRVTKPGVPLAGASASIEIERAR